MQRKMMKLSMFTKGIININRFKKNTKMQIHKPLPTIQKKPAHIKTKWFRDPNTGYWIQLETPTGWYFLVIYLNLFFFWVFRRDVGKARGISTKVYF